MMELFRVLADVVKHCAQHNGIGCRAAFAKHADEVEHRRRDGGKPLMIESDHAQRGAFGYVVHSGSNATVRRFACACAKYPTVCASRGGDPTGSFRLAASAVR